MAEATRYADEIIDDGFPWYAIRLFTTRQGEVKSYFEERGFECFIPMQYVALRSP